MTKMTLFPTTQNKVLTLSGVGALERSQSIQNWGKILEYCLYLPFLWLVMLKKDSLVIKTIRWDLNFLLDGIRWYQESRWSCKRLCNKGTPGIFQTCQSKIPKLPKSEKDQKKVPLKKRRGRRKYRRSFSHLGRRKRESRLTKEGDALATGAKTKTRINLLVKSHDMFPKSHAKRKEIRNEQKTTHGLKKKLKLKLKWIWLF